MPIGKDIEEVSKKILIAISEAGPAGSGSGSMWDIAESLNMSRGDMQDLIMVLSGEGLVQIKSLAGEVVLTDDGIEIVAALTGSVQKKSDPLAEFIIDLELTASSLILEPDQKNDLTIDLAALKGQASRTTKRRATIQALLEAIFSILSSSPSPEAENLKKILAGLPDFAE